MKYLVIIFLSVFSYHGIAQKNTFDGEYYSVNRHNWLPQKQPDGHSFVCKLCKNNIQLLITFGPIISKGDRNFFDSIIRKKENLKEFAKISVLNQIPIKEGVQVNILNAYLEKRFGIDVINYLAEVEIFGTKAYEKSYVGKVNNRIAKITINYFEGNYDENEMEYVNQFLNTLNFKNYNGQ